MLAWCAPFFCLRWVLAKYLSGLVDEQDCIDNGFVIQLECEISRCLLECVCRKRKNVIAIITIMDLHMALKRSAATNRYQILCCALFMLHFCIEQNHQKPACTDECTLLYCIYQFKVNLLFLGTGYPDGMPERRNHIGISPEIHRMIKINKGRQR